MDTRDRYARTQLEERINAKTTPRWPGMFGLPYGWYDIVERCDRDLEALIPGYSVQQIKEKFGVLRYYYEPPSDASSVACARAVERVRRAEEESAHTCENCGDAGKRVVIRKWYHTLCERDALSAGGADND